MLLFTMSCRTNRDRLDLSTMQVEYGYDSGRRHDFEARTAYY